MRLAGMPSLVGIPLVANLAGDRDNFQRPREFHFARGRGAQFRQARLDSRQVTCMIG